MDAWRGAVVVAGWLAGWWLLAGMRWVRPALDPMHPRLSIVVPARNEAASLPDLLRGVTTLTDVLVVDDGSSDGTAQVATAAGAGVVTAPPPPPGWTGKAWACHLGSARTHNPVLVFLDADVRLAPGALDAVVAVHARRGGLVSVEPWHECGRAVESLSAFFNLVSLMGTGAFSGPGARRSARAAFGPVLVCSRSDYVAVGGHAASPGDILDDVALARRFRAHDLAVTCLAGGRLISFRMYPFGLAQLVEGWTKNIAHGAGRAVRPACALLVAVWMAALASVAVALPSGGRAPAMCAYALFCIQLAWMLRRAGRFRWWAWLLWPVPYGFFLVVFARAASLAVLGRPVTWKGRRVET